MSQRRSSLAGAAIALALACAAALTACTGPGDPPAGTLSAPGSSPTGTTAPTGLPASTSPGATGAGGTGASSLDPNAYQPATSTSPAKNVPKPVLPEAAKKKDLEGQKAFIQYWISTYNYMRESGDTGPFLAACEKTSKFCSGSVKNLNTLTSRGIWRTGGAITLSNAKQDEPETASTNATWSGAATEASSSFFDSRGKSTFVKDHPNPTHYTFVAVLAEQPNGWRILEFGGDPA
ncbi:DUF6318 family protein [Galactobacter valiniphilus]|uniref:DUF6318 family protein n=1 Tax=Galactobacter valiniphilus TaxID=2676122 RepID=UPI0037360A7D